MLLRATEGSAAISYLYHISNCEIASSLRSSIRLIHPSNGGTEGIGRLHTCDEPVNF